MGYVSLPEGNPPKVRTNLRATTPSETRRAEGQTISSKPSNLFNSMLVFGIVQCMTNIKNKNMVGPVIQIAGIVWNDTALVCFIYYGLIILQLGLEDVSSSIPSAFEGVSNDNCCLFFVVHTVFDCFFCDI